MLMRFLDLLVRTARRERSDRFKRAFLLIGFLSFIVVTPLLLAFLGNAIAERMSLSIPRVLSIAVGIVSIALGLPLALWTAATQVRAGGIPLQVAPPRRLITQGPYTLCRNPMFLGGILHYLGLGSLLFSLGAGVFASLLGFLIGALYHRVVEERELVLKFGEEYETYRRQVPFLLPRLFGSRRS
jgi:protein-S-isoprenylcysteine O-methyltransferase Ste14